jgi:16S rRNA (cytidine1402-2'-O)-methyltransferase
VPGILYIVGTPIGNLKDITLHAIDVLKSCDLIACEDTRHTKVLLDEYSISTSTTSYHKFNIKAKTSYLIGQLKLGKKVALVSDAGMPGISDPGAELIKAALDEKIKVEVVPGPSAAVAALSVSGLASDRFVFEGFLPAKTGERKARLEELAGEERTIIIYEAPHRVLASLSDIREVLGDRHAAVVRELTKIHEEILKGTVTKLIDRFSLSKPKGEFVIVLEGSKSTKVFFEDPQLLVEDLVKAGLSRSAAVKITSKRLGIAKNGLYRSTIPH